MIDPSTRLRRAIITNDLLLTKRILKSHPSTLHTLDPLHASTALHLAASIPNSLPIVTYLVDVHHHESTGISRDAAGNTPLMAACAGNNAPVVSFLKGRFGKCVGWRNREGLTALMLAAVKGYEGCVRALLEERVEEGEGEEGGVDVDVDAVDGVGNTALHYASAYGHLKTIRTLIEHNASPHIQNRQKYTPQEFSFTLQAEQYFIRLVADKEVRDMAIRSTRAASPVFGRSEKAVLLGAGRQRASSGS